MGGSKYSSNHKLAAIIARLSSMGVKAGMAKRLQVLSTPLAKATNDMHRMYGNIARVIQIAAKNAPWRSEARMPLAIKLTTQGVARSPIRVTSIKTVVKTKATLSISCWVASADWVFFTSPKIGTKAWANAPSANNLRSRLGIRKATQNASVNPPAPKLRAIKISRNSPVMRDKKVKPLMTAADRNRLMARQKTTYA